MRLWLRVKSNAGSPDVERCKHVKSQATTVYFKLWASWLRIRTLWKGTAVHSVSRHKQRLQLLVGVGGVLVDLRQAVVDAAADVVGRAESR